MNETKDTSSGREMDGYMFKNRCRFNIGIGIFSVTVIREC